MLIKEHKEPALEPLELLSKTKLVRRGQNIVKTLTITKLQSGGFVFLKRSGLIFSCTRKLREENETKLKIAEVFALGFWKADPRYTQLLAEFASPVLPLAALAQLHELQPREARRTTERPLGGLPRRRLKAAGGQTVGRPIRACRLQDLVEVHYYYDLLYTYCPKA